MRGRERSSRSLVVTVVLALGAALTAGSAPACSSTEREPPLPVVECTSSEIALGMEIAEDARVFVDADLPAQVSGDVATYLSRMWRRPVDVVPGTPDAAALAASDAIWISASAAARERARAPAGGYALVRADEGGKKRIVVAADGPANLVTATYALLEALGARFFHPMQELVPELDAPRFPRSLEIRRTPMVKTRGTQLHLLHPLEYLRTFFEPGEASLAEAKRLVDWLVKTGQNHLQWPLLGSVEWAPFAEHARKIADYAHARGVTVGATINLSSKGSFQNNYVLVRNDATFADDIRFGLTRAFEVPWDEVEIALGEFLSADPEKLIVWLDEVVKQTAALRPAVRVSVQNHIGNYPDLYVDFRGEKKAFFYQLPRYADARLGQSVHTVFWFDMYRDKGMYEHPNFFFQREYLLRQLAEKRRVRYFPESAYWIAADVDVPAFLPEFIESRWIDIHRLDEDIRNAGLPPLDGHVMFSSGHEWGFWLTDYLAAKMLWEPAAPLERFVEHYASAFGSCAGGVGAELTQIIALQRRFLFEKELYAYVSGEDATVETGAEVLNHPIRKIRMKFEKLVTGSEADRAAFESSVLADLEALARELRPIEDSLAARSRGADAILSPWIDELRDGARIVRMRLEHALLLYRAVLAHARGDAGAATKGLAAARAKTDEARAVIEERERHYRFDVKRLTDGYSNPTFYPFGYLRQAHTQCLWRRREEFARLIIEENALYSTTDVPTCLN